MDQIVTTWLANRLFRRKNAAVEVETGVNELGLSILGALVPDANHRKKGRVQEVVVTEDVALLPNFDAEGHALHIREKRVFTDKQNITLGQSVVHFEFFAKILTVEDGVGSNTHVTDTLNHNNGQNRGEVVSQAVGRTLEEAKDIGVFGEAAVLEYSGEERVCASDELVKLLVTFVAVSAANPMVEADEEQSFPCEAHAVADARAKTTPGVGPRLSHLRIRRCATHGDGNPEDDTPKEEQNHIDEEGEDRPSTVVLVDADRDAKNPAVDSFEEVGEREEDIGVNEDGDENLDQEGKRIVE